MANRYHSFYLEELVRMVKEAAEKSAMKPLRLLLQNQAEDAGINTAMYNDRVAWFNEGLRELAGTIVKKLEETAEEEERQNAEALEEAKAMERRKREAENGDEQ